MKRCNVADGPDSFYGGRNMHVLLSLCLSLLLLSAQADAADDDPRVAAGKVGVFPVIGFQLKHDDNLLKDETGSASSWISVIDPAVVFQGGKAGNVYSASYHASRAVYHQSRGDDYLDHVVSAAAHLEFSSRLRGDASAKFEKTHDDRGSTFSGTAAAVFNTPDKFHRSTLRGSVAYGAATARGRLEMEGGYSSRRYDNHGSRTNDRDLDAADVAATLFYRVMPGTSALFEVKYKSFDYKLLTATRNRDSNEQFYYTGLDWKLSAKTKGSLKIGFQRKNFVDPGRDDFSSLGWEVGAVWSPRSYSRISLSTSSLPRETDGSGSFIKIRRVRLDWRHHWSSRLYQNIRSRYADETYVGDSRGRRDKRYSVGMGLNYKLLQWLSSGVSYAYDRRNSNIANTSYTRNVLSLEIMGLL
jgi:hypothetical protein